MNARQFLAGAVALLLCLLFVAVPVAAAIELPQQNGLNLTVINKQRPSLYDSQHPGTYYFMIGNNIYNGGQNAIHVSTTYLTAPGDITTHTDNSGTFYITDTGGKGYEDGAMLLIAVQENALSPQFSIDLHAEGYNFTDHAANVMPTEAEVGSFNDNAYTGTLTANNFLKYDGETVLQAWKPSTGSDGNVNMKFFNDQDLAGPKYNIILVDLNTSIVGKNAAYQTGLTNYGNPKVTYTIHGYSGGNVSFVPYAWVFYQTGGGSFFDRTIGWTDRSSGDSWLVTLPAVTPVAAFTADTTSGTAPLAVQFSDTSSNGPTSWAWDFDNDGTVDSTERNATYTFTTAGTYTVSLTATNTAGSDSEVKTGYITVTSGGSSGGSGLADSAWPKIGHDANNTGQSPYTGAQTNTTKWTFYTGAVRYAAPVIGSDGTVYMASKNNGLSAMNPDGTQKWHVALSSDSSPAIGSDGTIYTFSSTYLYALNPDGTQKWVSPNLGAISYGHLTVGPDGTIYFLDWNSNLDAVGSDGSLKWQVYASDADQANPAIGPDGTIYLLSGWNSGLDAWNPDGTKKWTYTTADGAMGTAVIGPDGTIYCTCTNGDIYAVNPDGTNKWTYNSGADSFLYGNLAMAADGTLYAGSDSSKHILAVNPDGTLKWKSGSTGILTNPPAIGADGTIYLESDTAGVRALNPADGSEKWFNITGYSLHGSPAIGPDGTVYAGSENGYLYAFKDASSPPGTAPVAAFSANATSGTAPLAVTFTDSSTDAPTSWFWDFGDRDSTNATAQNPVHTYAEAGIYTVNLTATNSAGSNTVSQAGYITVNTAVITPVASFTASTTSGTAPLAVTFTDTSANTPASWNWDFGDGTSSTDQNPSHTYTTAGTYAVILTATNAAGSNTATPTMITVNAPVIVPVAAFSANATAGTVPVTILFTDASTNTPTSWLWDFGDGSSSTDQNATHTYTTAGTYTVNLTATNTAGSNVISKAAYITVSNAVVAPVADFTGTPTTGTFPLTVQFTDASTGTAPLSYVWDFNNDGVIDSTVQNPGYTYATRGTYTVNLTVTNTAGSNTSLKSGYVTVTGARVWTVGSSGCDFTTITDALSNSALYDGDTIYVFNGTYTHNPTSSLTVSKALTLTGEGPSVVSIALNSGLTFSKTVTLSGIRFKDSTSGNFYLNGANTVVKNCIFTNNARLAIGADGVRFVDNTVDNTNMYTGSSGANRTYRNNSFSNLTTGSQILGVPICKNNNVVDNNTFNNFGTSGIYFSSSGTNNTISRNTFISGPAIQLQGKSGAVNYVYLNNFITSNSITYNGAPYTWIWNTTTPVSYTYNGVTHSEFLGNYWGSRFTGTDGNWDGISDTAYTFTVLDTLMTDNAPLMDRSGYYFGVMHSPTAKVMVTPASATLNVTESKQLAANATDSDGLNVPGLTYTWTSDNTTVGTVSQAGLFTALVPGQATITATTEGVIGTSVMTVVVPVITPVAAFSGTPTSGTAPLTVTFTDASTNTPTSWLWDFGDGDSTNATVQNPVHTYTNAGTFTVNLTATNNVGSNTISKAGYITVSALPAASFTANVTSGVAPLDVAFNDLSSNGPTSWAWDFNNDGVVDATTQNATYTYTTAGMYTVNLTASNAVGSNSTVKAGYISVTAAVTAPVSSFTAGTTSGTAPLTVVFTDTSTNVPTGWLWDFGDNDSTNATDQNPVHTYANAGTFTVNLTATNAGGSNLSSRSGFVSVSSGPVPAASFTTTNRAGLAPLTVQFTDTSTNSPTSWAWDFGDGSTATTQNPSHTYTTGGNYTVNLTATNANGQGTVSEPGFVAVLGSEQPIPGYRFFNVHVANDEGVKYDVPNGVSADGGYYNYVNNTYWILFRVAGGGGNPMHISSVSNDMGAADITSTTNQSGSFWITFNGGQNTMPDAVLLLAVNGTIPDDFKVHIRTSGQDFDTGSPSTNNIYQSDFPATINFIDGAVNQTFDRSDFLYGTQSWKPSSTAGVPIYYGEDQADAKNQFHLMFIDTRVGAVKNAALSNGGMIKVEYAFTNLTGKAVFNSYGWYKQSNHGTGIIMTNAIGGSEYSVTGIPPAVTPVAAFSANATAGTAPLDVQFTDASANAPTSWSWDFGDGGSSTLQNPVHSYASAGTYTVTLTATNAGGSNDVTKTGYITVNAAVIAPVASFTANTTSGPAPLAVQFNDTSANTPTSWAWDFNNDGTIDATTQNATYTYTSPGIYTVNLTATNTAGSNTASQAGYITVNAATLAPVAAFSANATAGTAPFAVQFTDASANTPTSWSWDFGDGSISTEQNATHVYTIAGTYAVNLTATNSAGSNTASQAGYITVTAATIAPVAAFSANATTGTASLAVEFTDVSTNAPTIWAWDFENDGIVDATTQNATHTYSSTGTYTVNLTATNTAGSDSEVKAGYITVMAGTVAPVAAFTANATSGTTPLTVMFNDTSANTPAVWAWDFDNDGVIDSTEQNATFTYASAGTYTVNLTVTNTAGSNSQVKTGYITVNAAAVTPVAIFSSDINSGTAPLTVHFTDVSDNFPTSWLWDFGDGGSSTERNVTHTYATAGTYTVNFTVANAAGSDSNRIPDFITVTATATPNPTPTPIPTTINPSSSISSSSGTSDNDDDGPDTSFPLMTVTVNIGGGTKAWQAVVTGTRLTDLIVTGTVQNGPGSDVNAPPGTVYQYFSLVPARYTSVTKAVISFAIPQSWLDENHMDPKSIVLYHQTASGWEALPTTVLYTKDGTVYFSAQSAGFSLFAIAGTPGTSSPAVTTAATIGGVVDERATNRAGSAMTPATTQTTAPAPAAMAPAGSSPIPVLPAFAVLGCVVLIGCGWYVRRWWIRKQTPALFAEYGN